MRGFSSEEETYFTMCELQYAELEGLDKSEIDKIEKAIDLLKKHIVENNFDFDENETDILNECFAIIGEMKND